MIKKARVRKPFNVVPFDTIVFLDWSSHLSQFFKKTIKDDSKRPLKILSARVIEYSNSHPAEVWVKYDIDGAWHKFSILKRNATPYLPDPDNARKYTAPVQLKDKKIVDLKKNCGQMCPENTRSTMNLF